MLKQLLLLKEHYETNLVLLTQEIVKELVVQLEVQQLDLQMDRFPRAQLQLVRQEVEAQIVCIISMQLVLPVV